MVSLEQRVSAGGKEDGDEVVLENQRGGREVEHLEESNFDIPPQNI